MDKKFQFRNPKKTPGPHVVSFAFFNGKTPEYGFEVPLSVFDLEHIKEAVKKIDEIIMNGDHGDAEYFADPEIGGRGNVEQDLLKNYNYVYNYFEKWYSIAISINYCARFNIMNKACSDYEDAVPVKHKMDWSAVPMIAPEKVDDANIEV